MTGDGLIQARATRRDGPQVRLVAARTVVLDAEGHAGRTLGSAPADRAAHPVLGPLAGIVEQGADELEHVLAVGREGEPGLDRALEVKTLVGMHPQQKVGERG